MENQTQSASPVASHALLDKSFSIRREVLNLTLTQWHILDGMDLTEITPREWIAAMGGKGGFLTALLNDEEREFVRIVFLPNRIVDDLIELKISMKDISFVASKKDFC